ncbi:MAG: hypothetical protein ACYDBJ_00015 [Aggregatilineales bacterium]
MILARSDEKFTVLVLLMIVPIIVIVLERFIAKGLLVGAVKN